MSVTKICARCGESFEAGGNRAIYCSEACKRGIRKCEQCQRDFVPTRHSEGRYCSLDCAYEARTGKPRADLKEARTCPVCQRSFIPPQAYSRTCSRECLGEWRLAQRAQKLAAAPESCAKCGNPIPATLRLAGGKFCGQECAYDSRGGGLHPNWQGGRHPDEDGYIRIWTPEGRRGEHQVVMEQALGRKLLAHEKVHHKNGQRDDNRADNLELWFKGHPGGQRIADMVEFMAEFYPDELRRALDRRKL